MGTTRAGVRGALASAASLLAIGVTAPPAPADPGDPARGERAYAVCSACHLESGAGRPDGTFPQLAGQHATVLAKQLADIREGRRDNPVMHPFALTLIDAQEIEDVAAYLEALPIPPSNGVGPGTELATGGLLYERDCAGCHGAGGEGDAATRIPVIAGQHYRYLLRQVRDVAAHRRRDANPEMVAVLDAYTDAELQAVADYASRLHRAGRAAESADGRGR